jgi:hypothetical protein
MKKISKKLGLASATVRVLSGDEIDNVGGARAIATTTVHRSYDPAAVACRRHSGLSRETVMCVRPPV